MRTIFINGTILTPDERLSSAPVVVEGEKITAMAMAAIETETDQVIDARGMYLIPGLIDVHVHGGDGFDTMDASEEALQGMAAYQAAHGVTAFLATTVTASGQDTLRAIRAVARAMKSPRGARLLGAHLEGPYLDRKYCGAQPPQHLRNPDPHEYSPWLNEDAVRLITVAPELPGAEEFIRAGIEKGVRFAAGHSNASYDQFLVAAELGLDQVTHIFNGMPPLHHRTPGILGAALTDERIYLQVIADGTHVHPAVLRLLVKAKGIDRIILISDAIRASGMPDGEYTLGDQTVRVQDGIARTTAGGLAGSTLTMDKAVSNMMRYSGLSVEQVLPMATRTPAKALGLNTIGRIAVGYDADLVLLDENFQVCLTMVAGQVVYKKNGFTLYLSEGRL